MRMSLGALYPFSGKLEVRNGRWQRHGFLRLNLNSSIYRTG